MSKKVEIIMKKVAIVSCDKWQLKISEDIKLKEALENLGIKTDIISWQQPLETNYDLLVLRSVWGYQNDYQRFRNWLLDVKNKGIPLLNNPDMILANILKNKQFEILKENNIEYISTYFLEQSDFDQEHIEFILNNLLNNAPCVIKPTISGSGENTFLTNYFDSSYVPNTILSSEIISIFSPILYNNLDCKIMVQPYVPEINNGEYSCVFIDGDLTHTMLRFPAIFHDKRRPYLVSDIPKSVLNLANKVESIKEFSNYLYMRVDIVMINGVAKIMEVELAEPDLLTKYIEDSEKQSQVIKTLAKKIERRIK